MKISIIFLIVFVLGLSMAQPLGGSHDYGSHGTGSSHGSQGGYNQGSHGGYDHGGHGSGATVIQDHGRPNFPSGGSHDHDQGHHHHGGSSHGSGHYGTGQQLDPGFSVNPSHGLGSSKPRY